MATPGDVNFKPEIFRKDFPQLIAKSMSRLVTMPVRLGYNSAGYPQGQVLARDPADGLYKKYDDAGGSGVNTAVCVLADAVTDLESSGTKLAVGIVHGELYNAALTGMDANGKTDVGGRTYTEADGTVIFSF